MQGKRAARDGPRRSALCLVGRGIAGRKAAAESAGAGLESPGRGERKSRGGGEVAGGRCGVALVSGSLFRRVSENGGGLERIGLGALQRRRSESAQSAIEKIRDGKVAAEVGTAGTARRRRGEESPWSDCSSWYRVAAPEGGGALGIAGTRGWQQRRQRRRHCKREWQPRAGPRGRARAFVAPPLRRGRASSPGASKQAETSSVYQGRFSRAAGRRSCAHEWATGCRPVNLESCFAAAAGGLPPSLALVKGRGGIHLFHSHCTGLASGEAAMAEQAQACASPEFHQEKRGGYTQAINIHKRGGGGGGGGRIARRQCAPVQRSAQLLCACASHSGRTCSTWMKQQQQQQQQQQQRKSPG